MNKTIKTEIAIGFILLIAIIASGFIWLSSRKQSQNTVQQIAVTKLATLTQQPTQQTKLTPQPTSEIASWQTYSSDNLGISFQYPKGWYVSEDKSINRIYVKNIQEDVNKGNMPSDFQQVWISTWSQEVSAQTENNVKNGKPDGRDILGKVSAVTMDSNGITINTYAYETAAGPTLQAFWKDNSGKKYYATNSTEVGPTNQLDMVANLKKILSTIKFLK